jgi:hypothetical protein
VQVQHDRRRTTGIWIIHLEDTLVPDEGGTREEIGSTFVNLENDAKDSWSWRAQSAAKIEGSQAGFGNGLTVVEGHNIRADGQRCSRLSDIKGRGRPEGQAASAVAGIGSLDV